MLQSEVTRSVQRVPYWVVMAALPAVGALTWAISSPAGGATRPDHLLGPYHVSLLVEYVLGTLLVLVAFVAWIWMRPRWWESGSGLAREATALLLVCTVFSVGAWRVLTSGVNGANIGGGLLIIAGPVIVSMLLVSALLYERRDSRIPMKVFASMTAAALCLAPLLIAVLASLTR